MGVEKVYDSVNFAKLLDTAIQAIFPPIVVALEVQPFMAPRYLRARLGQLHHRPAALHRRRQRARREACEGLLGPHPGQGPPQLRPRRPVDL
eukprot:2478377-Pyramimonas_sp.AAC.1